MSVNANKPHLYVLPEDDANRQIVNGFAGCIGDRCRRSFQILPIAGGWSKVVEKFKSQHIAKMRTNTNTHLALIIDFDDRLGEGDFRNRLNDIKAIIPEDLKDRVFIFGVLFEPENLRSITRKSFEKIGETLAKECAGEQYELWRHNLLVHNQRELDRIHPFIKDNILPD